MSNQHVNTPPNRRILVIDDNTAIHEDFRKILEPSSLASEQLVSTKAAIFDDAAPAAQNEPFEIDSAYQGQEGLAKVREAARDGRPYAMAFVDVRMPPGWDGIQTIERLWKEAPDLQVVICTAFSDYSWDDMIACLGQSDRLLILKKPFDVTEVQQLALAMAKRHDMEAELTRHREHVEKEVKLRTGALAEANSRLRAEISQRKRMEMELAQAQKLEAIGQLAAGIAHEINTPSQYLGDNIRFLQDAFRDIDKLIGMFTRLLESAKNHTVTDDLIAQVELTLREADIDYLGDETPKAIRQSLEGVDKVAIIVRAMKEFSHPGGSEKQIVDLNRAIESTLIVSRNEWKYVADLATDLDRDLPSVPCFPSQFNQVILNLVVNAAQAIGDLVEDNSGDKGTITVSTRHDGDWVEIRVQDTGAGIPKDIRPKVFDHFFTTKEVGKGTGQGLTIAHAIVTEKHGGTITFETEVGQGTTFVVRLPIADGLMSGQDVQFEGVQVAN